MAKSGTSIHKREKEKARVQIRLDKEVRRAESRDRRAKGRPEGAEGEDPDIAGIVPGPQPLPVEYHGGRRLNEE